MTNADKVYRFTESRIRYFTESTQDSAVRASLAELRRGVGSKPGSLPQLWGTFLNEMPEEFFGRNGEPSRAEWAVYTALTLFALHQQSKDLHTECMDRKDISFGRAVGMLVRDENDRDRVARRFNAAVTASDIQALVYYARGLIQLLRAEDIGLDYPAFAKDLYLWQLSDDSRDAVRLRWGQDFYYRKQDAKEENKETDTSESEE